LNFAGRVDGPRAGREEAAGVERGDVSPDKLFTLPCGNSIAATAVVHITSTHLAACGSLDFFFVD
jgi:hypothetical protein